MNDKGVGIALFNDPNQANAHNLTGVYCVAGKEPVRFIEEKSLPTHIRWLTNLDSDTIKAGSHVLPTAFATTTIEQMKQELGLAKMPLEHQAHILSLALDHVMQVTTKLYGTTKPPQSAIHEMMPSELRHANPIAQPEFNGILARAGAIYHTLDAPFHSESLLLSLVLPRFQHAHHLLKDGLPLCHWKKMEARSMGPKPERMSWVLSEVRPTISRVRITKASIALKSVIEAAFTPPPLWAMKFLNTCM